MARILHVISGLKVGGAETVLLRLLQSEVGRAHVHHVLAMDPEGEMRASFAASQISLTILDFKRKPYGSFLSMIRFVWSFKPDIVQTWLYHADLIGGIAARLAGVRHVIWGIRTTELSPSASRGLRWVRRVNSLASRWIPSRIVCVAEAARLRHAQLGFFLPKMQVIHNGLELDEWMPALGVRQIARADFGFANTDHVVGMVGRFSPDKDQKNFVVAASRIFERNRNARFLMVGRDCTFNNPMLAQWIDASACPENFLLLGERKDVASCLAAMDVFVLPSRTEGFPNVLGEAMAMGVPCVSTDVGDAAFLLGDAGPVVPARSSAALAQAVSHLLDMPEPERKALGAKGRLRVENEFSMAAAAQKFNNLYQELLQQKH